MKLEYWVAQHKTDSRAYNLRAKSLSACKHLREEMGSDNYGRPTKVTVTYADAFNLLDQCLGEGGGIWEEV